MTFKETKTIDLHVNAALKKEMSEWSFDMENNRKRINLESLTQRQLESLRLNNNPKKQPVGHYTGRCKECHSKNLWDDNHAYGCNDCGAIYVT